MTVWVDIPLQADWASPAELAARNSVTRHLDSVGIGKCTGAGAGSGSMDFSYRVSNEAAAREAIASAMQQLMPGVPFKVRVTP